MKFNCLIVDDERTAREKLIRYVKEDPRFEIIGQAPNGKEAITLIEKHQPQLVLLDVQMPGLSGFDVIRLVKTMPLAVVFTTAFDQYAVRAFEVAAVDYLLKPISAELLQLCLDKVATRLETEDKLSNINLLKHLPHTRHLNRIPVRKSNSVIMLDTKDILFFRSEHRLVMVYDSKGNQHWTNESLNHLLERLDPEHFIRVHRNAILNLNSQFELRSWNSGRLKISFSNELEITVSRDFTQEVKQKLSLS